MAKPSGLGSSVPRSRLLRKAEPPDLETLVAFIKAMAQESEGITLDVATVRAGIQAVLTDAAKGMYWVLTEASRPIGAVLITDEWSDWYNGLYWWLQSVYIQPECRGGPVFAEMLDQLETQAVQAGVRELRLYVDQHNARAIRAYQKNEFQSGRYQCMTRVVEANRGLM